MRYESKVNYGFLLDGDGDSTTTEDQTIWEGKNHWYQTMGAAKVGYPWNDQLSTDLSAVYLEYGLRTPSDTRFEPYQLGAMVSLGLNFRSTPSARRSASPTGGRSIDLTLARGYSDIVYAPYGGRQVDDGQLLDAYGYGRLDGRWTEYIPVPAWGGVLSAANSHRHTVQVDFQAGLIDKNVTGSDELRVGGQNPSYIGSDSLPPTTLFFGYPGYSLSGETMAVLNLAYRFPVRRYLNKKVGPFYLYDLSAQVMGTAGNVWSYRAPTDPETYYVDEHGDRVARNASAVRREVPFVGRASKNGNALLYDAGAELRLSADLLTAPWNCFFRAVWGFNEISGLGDVDGDGIQDMHSTGIGDGASNETEQPGPRFYVGLGTGW